MKKALIYTMAILLLLTCFGCSLQNEDTISDFIDQNLQGEVKSNSFTFVSGYASTSSTNSYTIYFFPSDPNSGYNPWDTGAYSVVFPYMYFTIDTDSTPQTYDISTFGTNGLSLTGYISGTSGVLFDDGEIEIISIDNTEYSISGRIWAISNEGTSSVSGNFEVPIEH